MTLSIDIETYSSNSINFGVHKYVEAEDFEILLFAYSEDLGEVKIIDLAQGEKIPQNIINKIFDPRVTKTAYNAQFEITCLSRYLNRKLNPDEWSCTMVLGAQTGLPFGLDNVAKVLNTIEQKDAQGKSLIKYFSMPCKPTKVNKGRTRNMPYHDIEKWNNFKNYCIQDVLTEIYIAKQLSWFKICDFEKEIWPLDQKINSSGVHVDLELVDKAVSINETNTKELILEMQELTGITNPKSVQQIKKFIYDHTGIVVDSLDKETISDVKEMFKDNPTVYKVIEIKEKLSFTSITKYTAIQNSFCFDKTVKGLFQYYGASRTGRWSGRNVQLQNLKRNNLDDLDVARQMVKTDRLDAIKLSYNDTGEVLSNLIRTAFIPREGKTFIISDFSAIEARIVAWFSQEQWRLDVFKTHGKIYEASASMMFKIPLENITKELRTKGKIAELALGYQGALGALQRMGGEKMGLSDDDMLSLVRKWRHANKNIVKLWRDVHEKVTETIRSNGKHSLKFLSFYKIKNNLIIKLPSGRELVYISACLKDDKIYYNGVDQLTGKWTLISSYGGKFVENIVQATARDVLADAMKRLDQKGFKIVMHIHDEIVIESDQPEKDEKIIDQILSESISWAPGLTLKSETFSSNYYKK